jgi:hypothetical protein
MHLSSSRILGTTEDAAAAFVTAYDAARKSLSAMLAVTASDVTDGIAAALATRWGWRRRGGRTPTWFELCDLLQPMQHSAVSGMGVNSPDAQLPGS